VTSQPDESVKPGSANTCTPPRFGKTFRVGGALAFLLGVVISAALIAYHNFSTVVEAVQQIGWGLGLIIAIYFLTIAFNSFVWLALFYPERLGFIKILLALRWIRESINYLLPSALAGGDIVGIRLLVAHGRDVSTATAVIVADKTLEAAGLFFSALASIFILLTTGEDHGSAYWAIRGLAVIAVMLIAFLLGQRWGMLGVQTEIAEEIFAQALAGALGRDKGFHAHLS
jgi:hypothetical protein